MHIFLLSSIIAVAAAPAVFASVGVHCGTTDDATLSDCQALVQPDTWNGAFAGTSNACHFGLGEVAYNVACHGNCCAYLARGTPNRDTTRNEAASLLGCGDTQNNKINELVAFQDGHGVCLSNGNGCGDCFDDSDFNVP
ncbi:hypothetical protein M422DRAFT_254658 [Sphaerobolus stellatus SS14]|uniref:Uncharacterized protein n=1 Tax=Sphaerobolus stellatus (strain SS14) TaxID=990650 RepID=A0A0C9VVD9_SPHS4|nr:hypothetical protein M422DRAFT_254658 [Sphaerobolus stellatus SS14]